MRQALIALLTLWLAGCASSERFNAETARFHRFEGREIGDQSVAIQPLDAEQAGLEFARYADLVGDQLASFGYRPAANSASADIVVTLGYSNVKRGAIDEGRSPVSVGVGVGGGSGNVGVGLSTMFGVGDKRSQDIYLRELTLRMVERSSNETIFEARSSSEGRTQDLNRVMPHLVDAVFAEFPGPNGQTTQYQAKIEPQ